MGTVCGSRERLAGLCAGRGSVSGVPSDVVFLEEEAAWATGGAGVCDV